MKDKFDMFNDMKIDEDKFDKVTLAQDEKDNMKLRMKISVRKKNVAHKKFTTVASVGIIALGCVVFTSETTWAYIENIGRQIEMFLNKDSNEFKGYKVSVNQEVTSEGIKLTLKEIMLDDGQMILSLNLDTKEFDYSILDEGLSEKNTSIDLNMPTIIINEMVYPGTLCTFDIRTNKDGSEDILIRSSLSMIDTKNDGLPDKDYPILENIDPKADYDIRILFNDFTYRKLTSDNNTSIGGSSGVVQGIKLEDNESRKEDNSNKNDDGNAVYDATWEFTERINGAKIMENIDVYEINKDIRIKYKDYDGILTVESIRVSPVSAKTRYKYKSNINMNENRHMLLPYTDVFDEKGNMITGTGSGTGDEYNYEFVEELDLTGKEKAMIIKVWVDDDEAEHGMKYIDNGEIRIDLDK